MNEKLPKPMLDALARGVRPAEHPSADVLAAFMERGLAEGDTTAVAEHLAACGECRDVVFLASSVDDEPVSEEDELLVAAAARGPQMRAAIAQAAARPSSPTSPPKRGSPWRPRLVWALSLSAVALVVGGYVMTQRVATAPAVREMAAMKAEEASPRAAEQLKDVATAPPPAASMAAPAPAAKTRPATAAAVPASPPAKPAQPISAEVVATARGLAPGAEPKGSRVVVEARTPAEDGQGVSIGGALAGATPAAPRASGFVASKGEASGQASALDSLSVAMQKAAPVTAHLAHPGWRITAQGHLEHQTPEGWTQVLAHETGAFRAVAVIGNHVWVGGDGGALFHSNDGGANWSKVALPGANGSEMAAIVTIRFSDAQHGMVITDSGQIYNTSDGGANWTKP